MSLSLTSRMMSRSCRVGFMLSPETCSTGRNRVASSTAMAATTSSV